MQGALVILIAMIGVGVVLYVTDLIFYKKRGSHPNSVKEIVASENSLTGTKEETTTEDPSCCGLHIVCEKTNLSPLTGEIVYYDDEELDRFKGRDPRNYTPEETEEFREVLMTLLPQDVAGWSRSIQVREIPLPPEIRDELLLIVSELRSN